MKLDKIKELIDLMRANDLSELEIVDGETRIALKRRTEPTAPQVFAVPPALSAPGANPETPVSPPPPEEKENPEALEIEHYAEIVAPIVGTYYTAPSPTAAAFVEEGSQVEEESVVCIIEAMKVMNEIKSGVKGTIRKMLVDNGSAVEYGQPLFLVEPE